MGTGRALTRLAHRWVATVIDGTDDTGDIEGRDRSQPAVCGARVHTAVTRITHHVVAILSEPSRTARVPDGRNSVKLVVCDS